MRTIPCSTAMVSPGKPITRFKSTAVRFGLRPNTIRLNHEGELSIPVPIGCVPAVFCRIWQNVTRAEWKNQRAEIGIPAREERFGGNLLSRKLDNHYHRQGCV